MVKLHNINDFKRKLILKNLDELVEILSKSLNFDSAILFGSFLNSNKFNDIDILLIKKENLKIKDFVDLYSKIIELNEKNKFEDFYLAYYDSDKKPKGKIKISLELDSPLMKEGAVEFYEKVFLKDESFKVIYGNLDTGIYSDGNIKFNHKKFLKYRKLIEFLHTTPTLLELEKFCENIL